MNVSSMLPGPFHDPLKREAQHYALSALPALCGTIATSFRLLARNSGRDTPGAFGHFPLRVLQDEIGDLANFLHVSVSFVAAIHVPKHGAEDGHEVGKEGRERVDD